MWPFKKRKSNLDIHISTPQCFYYPDENSPWKIQEHIFESGRNGYEILILRKDRTSDGYSKLTDSFSSYTIKVTLGLEYSDLEKIIRENYDSYENWIGLMFRTMSEAQRFIDDYQHLYDSHYLMHILSDVV